MEYTDGTMKFNVINNKSGGVLPGTILAFSGSFSDGYPIDKLTGLADKGWRLCDGTNGTPDLRGRFILGASDSHEVGSTGGEESHTLANSEMPERTVMMINSQYNEDIHQFDINLPKMDTVQSGGWTHTNLLDAKRYGLVSYDVNQPHNNMPPYYTLAFIMKI